MIKRVDVKTGILKANDLMAASNRKLFAERSCYVVNMMSSPGAGKTTIIAKTVSELKTRWRIGVIEGDLYTDIDARRIGGAGVPVSLINTQGGCHLDAAMVSKALQDFEASFPEVIIIENVGNLVCPAEFDLGEDMRVVVCSTTEGDDKPWKYPLAFHQAKAVLLNKIDLIPYTDFDEREFEKALLAANPNAELFYISARTRQGIKEWCFWLEEAVQNKLR